MLQTNSSSSSRDLFLGDWVLAGRLHSDIDPGVLSDTSSFLYDICNTAIIMDEIMKNKFLYCSCVASSCSRTVNSDTSLGESCSYGI